jgi:long-chain acyl-CoA synthetase
MVGEQPWLAGYPPDVDWHMAMPPETLVDLLDQAVARYPRSSCLYFHGKRWSYREVGELVSRVASGFHRLGATQGTRIGLCLPNCPFGVIAYFGALRAGCVVVNFNPLSQTEALAAQVVDSGTSIMVTVDIAPLFGKVHTLLTSGCLQQMVVGSLASAMPMLKGLLYRVGKRRMVARVPRDDRRVVNFAALTLPGASPTTTPRPAPGDLALLQYTGGTTGVPKGVELTHANLTANVRQVLAWLPIRLDGTERLLAILPLFHVFGMTTAMNTAIGCAAELVLVPRFQVSELLGTLRRLRPTLFPGVPTLYKAILDAGATQSHLKSVRLCLSGGAPLPLEVKRQFEAASHSVLVEGYGLTEAAPVCFCNPVGDGNRAGTIGLALPGVSAEIRSLENPLLRMENGSRGELCLRGPNVMGRYWNKPEETAGAMTPDGWLRTGDVGIMDAEGYVTLVDRIKDLIICSGYNVYPRSIEEAAYHHEAVVAATAVGMPDAYRGESPALFVQRRPGSNLTSAELRTFLADRLSPIEMPRLIELRDDLPRTAVGKLSRTELRAELLAGAAHNAPQANSVEGVT